MFQIANRRKRGISSGSGNIDNSPFEKWKKLMSTLPSGKSLEDTPKDLEQAAELKEGEDMKVESNSKRGKV